MPQTVRAVEYRKRLETGRNKPLVLECVADDGSKREYVVKLKSVLETREFALAAELLTARLADMLGFHTPQPAIVGIDPEFANSVPDDSVRKSLLASVGENFGSEYLSGGYFQWPKGKALPRTLQAAATDILAFDTFTQNPDRRPDKPNLLWKDERLIIYDHDLAFSFIFALGNGNPWDDEFEHGIRGHVFFHQLRGNLAPLERFQGALEDLDNAAINGIFEELPTAWYDAGGKVESIREYLPNRRDSAPEWLEAIRRVTA